MAPLSGRYTATIDGDFVVFLIGLRLNRTRAVRQWLPVLRAMPPMVRELERDPSRGLLSAHWGWMFGGPMLVQYWRSFEQLEAYARDPEAEHLPAWRTFNRAIRGTDAVGVYHETYRVAAGQYEAMYVDMPPIGLASARGPVPVGSTSTAARRLGREDEAGAPVAP